MKLLEKVQLQGKKVLLRVDFNVPIAFKESGKPQILDDSRIQAALPTIHYLLKRGVAKIILISHLGRPKGVYQREYSLWPVAQRLAQLLQSKKRFSSPQNQYQIQENIILRENVRFDPGEEKNERKFAQKLADGADLFVNDAFSCSHRAHASVEGVGKLLPSVAGFQLQKEVENLSKILNPQRPFVCVMGGAKAKEKIAVMENLASKTDFFLLGGVIANTFLKVKGFDIKSSVFAEEVLDIVKRYLDKFGNKIILPQEPRFGKKEGKEAILDIGAKDSKRFASYINQAKVIFWNGNLGVTEEHQYAQGSKKIAQYIVKSKAFTVAGGGDTVSFIRSIGLAEKFSFISLGGGAALEFLAGKRLPGLEILK